MDEAEDPVGQRQHVLRRVRLDELSQALLHLSRGLKVRDRQRLNNVFNNRGYIWAQLERQTRVQNEHSSIFPENNATMQSQWYYIRCNLILVWSVCLCFVNLREPLLINMVHHNNLIVVTGRWSPWAAERNREGNINVTFCINWLRCALCVIVHLRLRERGRTCGDLRPSSSVMLSVLPKCLDRKCSSSSVGWNGNWCSRSWDELED